MLFVKLFSRAEAINLRLQKSATGIEKKQCDELAAGIIESNESKTGAAILPQATELSMTRIDFAPNSFFAAEVFTSAMNPLQKNRRFSALRADGHSRDRGISRE